MRAWLRSLVNAILGKVPGKTSRLDTATRMAMDADFSDRREPGRDARPTVAGAQARPQGTKIDALSFRRGVRDLTCGADQQPSVRLHLQQ